MRFYPFGSNPFNPIFSGTAVSASAAEYARSASFGVTIATASLALVGVRGTNGLPGSCSFVTGSTGDGGTVGLQGQSGYISFPRSGSV
jgi:hypothetical protein